VREEGTKVPGDEGRRPFNPVAGGDEHFARSRASGLNEIDPAARGRANQRGGKIAGRCWQERKLKQAAAKARRRGGKAMLKGIPGWLLLAVAGGCLSGCSVMNSGPKMMETVAGGAVTVGTTMIERLDPKEMTANASGSITNPQFVSDGWVGTGVGWHATLQLVGADLRFGVAAAGQGSQTMDPATVRTLADIWMDPAHNEQERQALIEQTVMQWLLRTAVSGPVGEVSESKILPPLAPGVEPPNETPGAIPGEGGKAETPTTSAEPPGFPGNERGVSGATSDTPAVPASTMGPERGSEP
jgi:hypothetical protein